MLAVFAKEVAPFPELDNSLNLYTEESVSAMEQGLAKHYTSVIPNSFLIDLQPYCMLATTVDQKNSIIPRFFQAKDDIFCILRGTVENKDDLDALFEFNKDNDQITMFMEAYKSQRGSETHVEKEQREHHWLRLIRAVKGKFSIVLFDNLNKTLFAATDRDAHLLLYWGIDVKGDLVLTMDAKMAQLGCHKAYGSFPKGCYISTADGLKTFDNKNKEINMKEAVDSEGKSYMKVIVSGASSQGSTDSTARD
ncbi:Stem-specific protein TSJT1 [Cardamine amara subsp. amara]|uniref:Stem-specific protein TSJT1 n=1 Tax=Cardamine amara subsp. amara TaxID=228776 RepID=A0ABD0ZZB1_CARAN